MTLLLSLVIAVLFGSGCFLMLKRDLLRVAVGTTMISNAAIMLVISSGLIKGQAPIYPIEKVEEISDPLTQSLALTALVISFAISALLFVLVYRVFITHRTIDQGDLEEIERRERSKTKG